MYCNRFSIAAILSPLLTLLLVSCDYEKKEKQLKGLVTEVRFLQQDLAKTSNEIAHAKRKEAEIIKKFNIPKPTQGKTITLEKQLETARAELATKKAAYGKLLLDIESYKNSHSIEKLTIDQSE